MADISSELEEVKANQRAHDQRDIERFASVHETLRDMKDNHLFHIEKDVAQLKEDSAEQKLNFGMIKTDLGWVKWGVLAVLSSVGTIVVAIIISALLSK